MGLICKLFTFQKNYGPMKFQDISSLLRVETFRLISAMGILVIRGLLMVITYHPYQRMKLMGLVRWMVSDNPPIMYIFLKRIRIFSWNAYGLWYWKKAIKNRIEGDYGSFYCILFYYIIIIYPFFLRIQYAIREGGNMIMECMYFLQWKMVEECKHVWLCPLLHLKR